MENTGSLIQNDALRKKLYVFSALWIILFGAFTMLNSYYNWFPSEEVALWRTVASFIFNAPTLGLAAANATSKNIPVVLDPPDPDPALGVEPVEPDPADSDIHEVITLDDEPVDADAVVPDGPYEGPATDPIKE